MSSDNHPRIWIVVLVERGFAAQANAYLNLERAVKQAQYLKEKANERDDDVALFEGNVDGKFIQVSFLNSLK